MCASKFRTQKPLRAQEWSRCPDHLQGPETSGPVAPWFGFATESLTLPITLLALATKRNVCRHSKPPIRSTELQTTAQQYFPTPSERLHSRLAHTQASQLAISIHLLSCATLAESLKLSSSEKKHLAVIVIGFTIIIIWHDLAPPPPAASAGRESELTGRLALLWGCLLLPF